MRCLKCGSTNDKVIDSRLSKDGNSIRRRRMCLACNYRYTTYEHIERSDLVVAKMDGRRESFSKDKLFKGLMRACEKRPIPTEVLEEAVDDLINELHAENHREVPSSSIGLKVMERLSRIDPVAYVRYASVYRQFEDVGEFLEEIQTLGQRPYSSREQPELFRIPNPRASRKK
ncbi:MAG: transcriptional regulator NrdR [Verrucomicrobiota bacterium]